MHSSAQTALVPTLADVPVAAADTVESVRGRIIAALLCSVLVTVPFVSVQFPPITDLPQHVAQIRLFLTAWNDPDSGYRIQWFTPYSAAYALLGAVWALSTPANAGRLAMMTLAILWTLAAHGIATRRQRPVAAATLASALFFNHAVYWGFFSFALGWTCFVVWVLFTCRSPTRRWSATQSVQCCALAALLYVSHVLWFVAGVVWLLVVGALHGLSWRQHAQRFVSIAPVLTAVAVWYPHLSASGFRSDTVWVSDPTARISFSWLAESVLGGLRGPSEGFFLLIVVAWIGGGLWTNRSTLRRSVDRDLLAAGLMLVAFALLLPDKHMNTIQFAARWMPSAAILLLLAVPAPAIATRLQPLLAFAATAVFCLTTALAWQRVEREELSGFSEVLAQLPPTPRRVMGLDFIKHSAFVNERPFLQMFAYAQVVHGGTLNFSFAGFAPSLVVFQHQTPRPWTGGLEWFAERVRPSDFQYFDYVVVNGTDAVHLQLTEQAGLLPQTNGGRWRLYRVPRPSQ